MSEKHDKSKECLIKIMGNIQNKLEAAKMILHHLEAFKNGGKVP